MARKQPKKQTEKVYRSIAEFKQHFFPNYYEKELVDEKAEIPQLLGLAWSRSFWRELGEDFRVESQDFSKNGFSTTMAYGLCQVLYPKLFNE